MSNIVARGKCTCCFVHKTKKMSATLYKTVYIQINNGKTLTTKNSSRGVKKKWQNTLLQQKNNEIKWINGTHYNRQLGLKF